MNVLDLYKKAYTSKEANILIGAGKAGLALGNNAAMALALGLPVATGVGAAYALSKITDPTETDLANFEREAYISELRSRLDRLKKLPKSAYTSSGEGTLRI